VCFIFARTRTTPEDFQLIKQKNEKDENGSFTKNRLICLGESGNPAASNQLHEAAETPPERAAKISLAWKKEKI
jgi:hypothetical protein